MRYFPQFSRSYVEEELSMAEGWALLAGAIQGDGWLQFSGVQRKSPGYVAQQISEILKNG